MCNYVITVSKNDKDGFTKYLFFTEHEPVTSGIKAIEVCSFMVCKYNAVVGFVVGVGIYSG